ncbi:MAG TPA: carbon storage regulator [Gemmataceae bacterium]|jgi:carbon storage regulator
MLVLTRKQGEQIIIGENIRITVLAVEGNRVRLGLTAPDDVSILRVELGSWRPGARDVYSSGVQAAAGERGRRAQPARLIE